MSGIGSGLVVLEGAIGCWQIMEHGSELETGTSGGVEAWISTDLIPFSGGISAGGFDTSLLGPFDDVIISARTGASTSTFSGTIVQATRAGCTLSMSCGPWSSRGGVVYIETVL